jgi:hypothetical protein
MKTEPPISFVYDAEDMSFFEKIGNPELCHNKEYLSFNGISDGVYHPRNPLYGITDSFFVEMMIFVDPNAKAEQRFLHMGSKNGEPRMLFETRLTSTHCWYLDTVLADHKKAVFLMDPDFNHPLGTWVKIKMIYNNSKITTFVNDLKEIEHPFEFSGIHEHGISIGVRQNLVSWFNGKIKYLRVGSLINPNF